VRALFVSPHSDDICLSLGALSSHLQARKHLVTVFSLSCWAEPTWVGSRDTRDVTAARREEDRGYCDLNDFAYHSLDLADSSVRHVRVGNLRLRSGHEELLQIEVERGLDRLIEELHARVMFAPLGLGNHTDHVTCSDAARRVAIGARIPVFFYEDLPYAGELSLWGIRRRVLGFDRSLRPLTCLTHVSPSEKLAMTDAYASQQTDHIARSILVHSRRLAKRRDEALQSDRVVERVWSTADPAILTGLLTGASAIEVGRNRLFGT